MDGCYAKFDEPDRVVRCVEKGPLCFAELWHGPTGAFKDLSLAVLGRVVDLFLERRGERSVVLVSTSGDTGSAAIHSVLGLERLQVMVMYPRHMISKTQRLQMTTVSAPNVHVFSLEGSSDDGDVVTKKLFADTEFAKRHNLNVFNSPNVCRLLVQSAHFIYLYLQQCPAADQEVLFCVPTGGLGNISSGMLARGMGFPVKFLAAVNENDTVYRALERGVYETPPTVLKTLSCAMDISVPYNMERIFHCFSLGDGEVVSQIMREFERSGSCVLPPALLAANDAVSSVRVGGDVVVSTMREVWQEYGYLVCPHTAVATRAALDLFRRRAGEEGEKEGEAGESARTSTCKKLVVICTATPAKFAEAADAAGLKLPPSPKFDALDKLQEKKPCDMDKGQDWEQIMRKAIENAWD